MSQAQNPWFSRIGWTLTILLTLLFLMSAGFKLAQPEPMKKDFVEKNGFPANTLVPIGVAEAVCVVLFLIPRTSVLGAILLTGYMGGAICAHVRLGEPFIAQAVIGALPWLALWLREPRLRELAPLLGEAKSG